jgi:hypothetical protein
LPLPEADDRETPFAQDLQRSACPRGHKIRAAFLAEG